MVVALVAAMVAVMAVDLVAVMVAVLFRLLFNHDTVLNIGMFQALARFNQPRLKLVLSHFR